MPRTGTTQSAVPDIELERRNRIQALQEKMASVLAASQDLQQAVAVPEKLSSRPRKAPALRMAVSQDSGRRSGRIAGRNAINYDENHLSGVDPTEKAKHPRAKKALFSGKFNEACREESYSAEHVQALGVATEQWVLFKDGYCAHTGKRIYDKVDGVTCHQCRQKTLGARTSCSRCHTLFGQLCGDCLFMRYGENVTEANAAEEWICPCCRDLCNCSAHRSRRGWAPTGTMYRAALAEGYLSVAHCLVLNRLAPDALNAVRAGTLLVPGGYPEKWAEQHGAPFPPPIIAACAHPSQESEEGTEEAAGTLRDERPVVNSGAPAEASAASEGTVARGSSGAVSEATLDETASRAAARPPLAPVGGVMKNKQSAHNGAAKQAATVRNAAPPAKAPVARRGKITRSMAKGLSGVVIEQPVLRDATNSLGGPAVHTIHRHKPGKLSSRLFDSIRWAGALGCFGAVYVSVDEATRTLLGCNRSAHFRSALAGAAAGPSILLTGLSRRHDEFALYFLLRGLTLLIRIGNKPPESQQHPTQSPRDSSPVAPATPPPVPPPTPRHSHPHAALSTLPEHGQPQPESATRRNGCTQPSGDHGCAKPAEPASAAKPTVASGQLEKGAKAAARGQLLYWLLAPTRWQHGDVLLMCIASWRIVFSYVMAPQALPASMVAFLDKMIGAKWLVPIVREFALRGSGHGDPGAPLELLRGTPLEGRSGVTMCDVLHPHSMHSGACDVHFASVLPPVFWRAVGVYVPVYAASMLAVQRGALFKRPLDLLGRSAAGVARSALFLALYVALAHRGTCFINRLSARSGVSGISVPLVAAMSWLPGLAILVEKKSRRMELALFCTCRAVLTMARHSLQRQTVPRWLVGARTDVLMLSAACACVMHCYSGGYGVHRDIFRSKYRNVLDFLFGNRGMHAGVIAHADSNRALILRATAATTATVRSLSAPNLAALR
eukprot:jgi/Ulvmu1/7764/UM039_0072.1